MGTNYTCGSNTHSRWMAYHSPFHIHEENAGSQVHLTQIDIKHYPDLFSVSPQIRDWYNQLQAGRVYGHFILGSFVIKADPRHYERLCYTLYTSGAASAVKRDKFIALGGFDEYLYIYEDVDLSYRAWKRGWTAFYEPRSVVYHKGRATSKALFPDPRYLTINLKNRHWFIWKNLTDHAIQRRYWALLPLSLAFFTLRMHSPAPLFAFKEALEERERVLEQSTQELSLAVRTDVEVLNFVKNNIYVNE